MQQLRPIAFLLSFLLVLISPAQDLTVKSIGVPFIQNYAPADYGGSPQNWQVIEDNRGVLYFTNNTQVLEYDGSTWRTIKIPNTSIVRSLAIDDNGRIYVAASGQIGYLEPDVRGQTQFVSITSKIPKQYASFGDIYRIHHWESSMVFSSFQSLFIYKNDTIHTVSNPKSSGSEFFLTHQINDQIFVSNRSGGLFELLRIDQEYELKTIEDGDFLGKEGVYGMLPFPDGNKLIITGQGAYTYDEETKSYDSWKTEAAIWLSDKRPSVAVQMQNGDFAIGTHRGGVLITNGKGEVLQVLDKRKGLVNNLVSGIYSDYSNNLWVCTNNGLSYVETGSPFTLLGSESGVEGAALAFLKSKNHIYVGTGQGLFYANLEDWSNPLIAKPFNLIEGTETAIWYLKEFGDVIVCGVAQGVYQIKEGKLIRHIQGSYMWDFNAMPDYPNKLVSGSYSGDVFLYDITDGELKLERKLGTTGIALHNLIYQDEGYFIAANDFNDVLTFRINETLTAMEEMRFYSTDDGLPAMNGNTVYNIQGQPLVGTSNGIYSFDYASKSFRVEPKFLEATANKPIMELAADSENNLMVTAYDKTVLKLDKEYGLDSCSYCFNDLASESIYRIVTLDNEEVLFGGGERFIHYDAKINKDYYESIALNTLIRSVEFMDEKDSLIYGGGDIGTGQGISQYSYQIDKLRFSYSLLSYKDSESNVYSYKLDGQDDYWSEWSSKTIKEYTNLSPGAYAFSVRGKNFYNHESNIATYAFTILAPWYLTIWAYIGYFLLFILIIWVAVKTNARRLKKENEKLEYTILERTQEIRYQAEKLQTLDNAKSRFFANISHELRTPLTLIQGPLESVLNGSLGKVNETIKSNLDLSRASTKKLLNLVEEILDLSKLEAGKLELKTEAVRFHDLVKRIFFTYQSSYSAKSIQFQFDYQLYETAIFRVDIGKLEKILDNLMSNAVKFTEVNGLIKMEVSGEKDNIKIEISDTGIGIGEDELDQIFNRFYQAGKDTKYTGGTGIGLSLAKELATLMNGDLQVKSELGEGTTFTLTIPMEVAVQEDVILSTAPNEEEIAYLDEKETVEADPLNLKTAKILIVEDDDAMRSYIKAQLGSYSLDEAADGLLAIEKLETNSYDLVITDLMMPKLDGLDLVTHLRANESTRNISVIMLTARAADEDIVNALTIGVNDYMIKPFNPEELKARVVNVLTNRMVVVAEEQQPTSANEKRIAEMKEIVKANMKSSSFNVSTLASEVAISERQLSRNIQQITGLTAGNFIREVRLNEARILLENRTYTTISEVAYAVGFEKPGYFSEVYSKRFGKKPSDYLQT
ncbi:MAG: ATP-binding protein [Cyclobacteriaceae bacterium]